MIPCKPGAAEARVAFRDALAAGLPQMQREHKGARVGTWTAATEDDIGLKVTGTVTDPATLADLRSGRLDGLSIGFVATKAHRDPAGKRVLDQVTLPEISIVKRPASSRARVLSVKSAPAGKEHPMDTETAGGTADETTETKSVADLVTEALAPVTARLDKLETVSRRPGAAVETKAAGEPERKSFERFVRHGRESLDHLEVKSLRVSDDTAGGYLAPDQFVAALLRNIVAVSPVRQIARVATTRGWSEAQVTALVEKFIEPPQWGFLGEPRVNVLLLNVALDAADTKKSG